jgi:starch phosphorylase
VPHAEDAEFRKRWLQVKRSNQQRITDYIGQVTGIRVDPESMFDCQTKRIHEYKRQLMNCFHVIHLYNQIKDNPNSDFVPRTVIFAGKAAPGYYLAKLIIKLINSVADVVNRDQQLNDLLKVVFLPNYCVSQAEKLIPAADLSEQISTAGMEASGTGNMKYALNGALTIGTLDGANIEIKEEVEDENIFIFGLTAEEVLAKRKSGYNPKEYYEKFPPLKRVLDMIMSGYFSRWNPDFFKPITESLLNQGDYFMVLADFESYVACQQAVSTLFLNQDEWTRKAILNVARMGKFSSDRAIAQYTEEIWTAKPVPIHLD